MVYKIINGAIPSGDEWMINSISALKVSGRNTIRELQDRSVDFSADGGEWAEAYTDSNGQKNSVDTSNTTANFDTNKYQVYITDEASSDTTYDPNGITDASNFFDGDDSTYAKYEEYYDGSYTKSLGKTFSSKNVKSVKIKVYITADAAGSQQSTITAKIQTYDGSSWNDVTTLFSETSSSGSQVSETYNDVYTLDSAVQGIRIQCSATNVDYTYMYWYTMEYGDIEEKLIYHTLPSGSYSSTISSSFGVALVTPGEWETGADIQYKLTNAAEDTGWLNTNEIATFTAFTSEPTKCIVKLIPKSGVTSLYPSIKGFMVVE